MGAFDIISKALLLTLLILGSQSVKAQITCDGAGLFPLNDMNCQYYYVCSFDGVDVTAQVYKCPDGTVFDPDRSTCVLPIQYACMLTTTTIDPYQCLTTGRFPIDDPTCQQYYYCYWNTNRYVKRIFKCPNQTIFNPISQLCVLRTTYICTRTTTKAPAIQ
ncbi:hypothetical protein M0802_001078 [Mischocyttarus mexicanus]|nr:hypothetical protein M0802_001078 [Mischocyttarus mexicanus]